MIRIYGASDDLIEVEGDLREEFNPRGDQGYIACSNGLLFSFTYDFQGNWRFTHISGPKEYLQIHDIDPDEGYSEVIDINEEISWVALLSGLIIKGKEGGKGRLWND